MEENFNKKDIALVKPAHSEGKNATKRFYFYNKKGDVLAYVTKIGTWKDSQKLDDQKIRVSVLLRNRDIYENHTFTEDEIFNKCNFKQGEKIFYLNDLFIINNLGKKPTSPRNRFNTHQHGCPAPKAWRVNKE